MAKSIQNAISVAATQERNVSVGRQLASAYEIIGTAVYFEAQSTVHDAIDQTTSSRRHVAADHMPHHIPRCILPVVLSALAVFVSNCARAQSGELEFAVDVMSVLSKAGCNSGTCHGNLNGKGGLKLSLRGQDPQFDFEALVLRSRGRRTNPSSPGKSLILQKATAQVPHRGGRRFAVASAEYQVLRSWIAEGTPSPASDAPRVVKLEVIPRNAILTDPIDDLQLRVTAVLSDGSSRDVTQRACYELSNLIATVDPDGRVTRDSFGETTLIVRYLQMQVPVSIAFTAARPEFEWSPPATNNSIDRFVFNKLHSLRMNPSTPSKDHVFVRRAYLDAIGRVPTGDEAKAFVASNSVDKRTRLIDYLLSTPEFADLWALKWADVLRTEEKVLDTPGVEAFHQWIRDGIASAKPLDAFVRELVTGTGSTYKQPAANFYRANRTASIRGETTARLFLGTRLQCAKCHNHPFDRWTQNDYYEWSSLFSQLDYELGENKRKDKLDKNEFAGDQVVLVAKKDEVRNPTTGEIARPKFLGGDSLSEQETADRLMAVAQWLTSDDNELFAKSQVNFIWYHIMGQGLVDPIDDFRLTNPASNPPLLDTLAAHFVSEGFDLRSTVRMIMNSQTYQLSAEPNETNVNDHTSYARASIHRLPAEVLLDAQSDVLDMPAEFVGYPHGIRAVQVPGVQRKRPRDEAPLLGDRFLKTFGKPDRILACECERSNETTLKQVFALIGQGLSGRLATSGNRIHQLASSTSPDKQVVETLYWEALSRPPNSEERDAALSMLDDSSEDRFTVLQDIAWALLNAKEFLFRR
ncbi:MAG: DUF1549 domain-containing protein [Planctomycetes bacterium]|nr:DUF1549 domain-containing protein [Planctomycetota bacterium]